MEKIDKILFSLIVYLITVGVIYFQRYRSLESIIYIIIYTMIYFFYIYAESLKGGKKMEQEVRMIPKEDEYTVCCRCNTITEKIDMFNKYVCKECKRDE